jgi:hypothetical protein
VGADSGSTDFAQEMEELLDIVGEEQITGYQLKDIFDENKVMATVKRKLVDKVAQNTLISKGLVKDSEAEKEEKEDSTKKKKQPPQVSIEALLKGLGLSESLPKLKKHEIADNDTFFELTDDKMIELLEIKTEGKKMRFKDKIKEVRDKHEKDLAKKEAAKDDEPSTPQTFELLQKKSTIVF